MLTAIPTAATASGGQLDLAALLDEAFAALAPS